ncbi:unnamed protein product [Rhodiola kirilowii]
MWKYIADRESGTLRPNSFASRFKSTRVASIDLSNHKEFVSPHKGAINSLQVDLAEGRYLLSGAADASVAVFDVQGATDHEGGGLIARHKSIFTVDKQHESGHQYAISSAIWYPIDTGLFITGSYDHLINVWDTNTTQVVMNFNMPGKVYKTAMSPLANSHMLLAAGTEDVQVRLCDISSGAFTHMLSGHPSGFLMTGGCDGAIRFWDIRRAGSFQVLDQSQSQLGRRPPVLRRCVSEKGLSSKSSPSSHTANARTITGLKVTEDGMYLLSAGSDSRLRLWDIESGRNTLVNYETARLQGTKPTQLAVTQDSSLVYVPCMNSVKVLFYFDLRNTLAIGNPSLTGEGHTNVLFEPHLKSYACFRHLIFWSGRTFKTFRGHYESVNCCCFNFHDQELYTGGNDRQILVWSPPSFTSDNLMDMQAEGGGRRRYPLQDQDNWSD